MTTTTEYLYSLPEAMQDQLARIARTAAGMSAEEKLNARLVLGGTAMGLALSASDDALAGANLISALGLIVSIVDDEARSTTTEAVA